MANSPGHPDSNSDPGTPRWVKVSGIIVIVLVLMVVIVMFTGIGGPHGPGRHIAGGGPPPSSVTDVTPGVHTPPEAGQ